MAFDPKALIKQLRGSPRVLRVIGAIAAVDLLIILYAFFSLEDDVSEQQAKITELQTKLTTAQEKMGSVRKEIGQLPELRKLYDTALANNVLASQDRLKFVNLAQDLARSHRLTGFYFKLSPEVTTPLPGGKYQLTSTEVGLNDTALLSSDVFAFWEEVLKRSQAHFQIISATVERTPDDVKNVLPNIKNGTKAELIKADLKFRWQSMRAPAGAQVAAAPAVKPVAPAAAAAPVSAADTIPAATPISAAAPTPAAGAAPVATPAGGAE